jgi:hypothetical protein
MPGLIGYMLAIVVTLGGYFAGLHWLISPPDPWRPDVRIPASTTQQIASKKRPPVVKPAETAAVSGSAALTEPNTRLANVEASISAATSSENETPRPIERTVVQAPRPAEVPPQLNATRPVVEPVHAVRREVSATKPRSANRRRVERSTGRKLELMVLRTYERSDVKRFTRLLPLSGTRNAMAFQPDDQW